MSDKPIGIFDSGIGGLTVLKELIKVLPEENTIYLGDTARVPYGTKSAETVIRYSLEIAEFLTAFDIKALVEKALRPGHRGHRAGRENGDCGNEE